MISCPMISSTTTSDEMGHSPQAQDLRRSKHILAEGKTLEEVTILSTNDLIGVTQNLRVVKERQMVVWIAESKDLFELGSSTREILQCL